jgi:hypothetical protein
MKPRNATFTVVGCMMVCPACLREIPDASLFCNLCGKSAQENPPSNDRTFGRSLGRLLPILGVVFIGWCVLRVMNESHTTMRQATQAVEAVVRAPITLKDEVQNLRAASWQGIALNVPYNGEVDVDLTVVQGNPIDVFITASDQLAEMQQGQWNQVRVFQDFNATKMRTYRRKAQLNQGSYYLVLRDTSLGILSARASDISVKVVLNP